MNDDLTGLKFFLAGIFRPLIREAVTEVLQKQTNLIQSANQIATAADTSPIISKKHVKEMTGWPDGTFYQKVREMPEGVVIRGKSKRLLFDRQLFMEWLKAPVQP